MKRRVILALFVLLNFTLLLAYPGKIIKQMAAPGRFCTGLTFDGKYLWVADYQRDSLYQIDPHTQKVIRAIPSPGFWPMGLAWDGHYLWNADRQQKKIFQIDPGDGSIVNVFDAPSSDPQGLTWDGHTLWVSDGRSNKIMSLDMNDGTAVKRFRGPARRVNGLSWDGHYLWASDRLMNELYMIDPQSGAVLLITDAPGPYVRGLTFDGKNLWAIDFQTDSLYCLVRKDKEKYRLKNKRHALVTLTHEVKAYGNGKIRNLDVYFAVPENLPQQKILSVAFAPNAMKPEQDQWGQPIGWINYKNIQANADVKTVMKVETEISAIDYFIFPEDVGTLQDIPADIRTLYTKNGSKYMIDSDYIQHLAKQIVGKETRPYWMARKIFDYVRNHLEYKLEGGWNVAPVVLKRGTGSCSEYSISFIALARAAGLPARFVGAIVVRGDDASMDDVFHRWPEVYLPNYGWIPIDPQGGDKTLPRDQAMNIGHLPNRFLITTHGGGDSQYLGWYYNYNQRFKADAHLLINIETFAEWQPLPGN